jgi:hypothetical protein
MKILGFTIEARSILRTVNALSDGLRCREFVFTWGFDSAADSVVAARTQISTDESSGLISVQGIACSTRAK